MLSIYVAIDPADRRGGWRTLLRDGLRAAVETGGGEGHRARAAAAVRVEQALRAAAEAAGRGIAGFADIGTDGSGDRWFSAQYPPRRTEVTYGLRPRVGPLLALLDDGAPRGLAILASDRVRLLDWRLGSSDEVADDGLESPTGDWRERKAPRSRDPAAGQMVSSAGRDQHEQRLDAVRERFARDRGGAAAATATELGWRELIVFGDPRHATPFAEGFGEGCPLRHVDGSDLISQPSSAIAERFESLLPGLNQERELGLIATAKESAHSGTRGALGPVETMQTLEQGRVEHLLIDASLSGPDPELMVQLALKTGAAVTPVEGDGAAELAEQSGVVALLRY